MRVLLALLFLSSPTLAAPSAKRAAAALIDEGNVLLEKGQHEAALARYQAAHELYPTPKIFFNMAEASREIGRLVEASRYFERFLRESGVSPRSRLYRAAERKLAAVMKRLGVVAIVGTLGAEVFVDGVSAGRLPVELRALPGPHELVVEKPSFLTRRLEIEVRAGERHELDVTLDAPPPPLPPVTAAPPPPLPPPPLPVVAEVKTEDEGSVFETWWFWTLVGGVAIGVGAAVLATQLPRDPHELDGELGVSSTRDWRPL